MTHFNLHTLLLSSQMAPVIDIKDRNRAEKVYPFHPYSVCKLIGCQFKHVLLVKAKKNVSNQVKFKSRSLSPSQSCLSHAKADLPIDQPNSGNMQDMAFGLTC